MDTTNNVKSPLHYRTGNIECIAYIKEVLGPEGFCAYCQGNTTKYLHRHPYKLKPIEDLEKAYEYLGWQIETMKEIRDDV